MLSSCSGEALIQKTEVKTIEVENATVAIGESDALTIQLATPFTIHASDGTTFTEVFAHTEDDLARLKKLADEGQSCQRITVREANWRTFESATECG